MFFDFSDVVTNYLYLALISVLVDKEAWHYGKICLFIIVVVILVVVIAVVVFVIISML